MFWKPGPDSINCLFELTEQKRIEDPWYNEVLMQCRNGELDDECYCFLLGLPTRHVGTWRVPPGSDQDSGFAGCGKDECKQLHHTWQRQRNNRCKCLRR